MDEWIDGCMDGWVNGWIEEWQIYITFFGATKHLYNWPCTSVGRLVGYAFDDPKSHLIAHVWLGRFAGRLQLVDHQG